MAKRRIFNFIAIDRQYYYFFFNTKRLIAQNKCVKFRVLVNKVINLRSCVSVIIALVLN